MKNIIFITISLFVIISCKPAKIQCTDGVYLITKIDSVDNYYIIYAKQNSQNCKLLSEKSSSNCEKKITVGKKFCLATESIFTMKVRVNDTVKEISNNVNIDGILIGTTKISKEYDKGIFDVLKSKNLVGLCYSKTSN